MQTPGGLAHMDFDNPLLCSHEEAFNVLAWNCDDHVKNVSFLMDRDGNQPGTLV